MRMSSVMAAGALLGLGGQSAGQRPDVICQRLEFRPRLIDLQPCLRRRTQRARSEIRQSGQGRCEREGCPPPP